MKCLVPWWSQTHVWNLYVTYFTISFISSFLSIVIYAKWTFYIKFYSKIFSFCICVIESKCVRREVLYELHKEMFTPLSHNVSLWSKTRKIKKKFQWDLHHIYSFSLVDKSIFSTNKSSRYKVKFECIWYFNHDRLFEYLFW